MRLPALRHGRVIQSVDQGGSGERGGAAAAAAAGVGSEVESARGADTVAAKPVGHTEGKGDGFVAGCWRWMHFSVMMSPRFLLGDKDLDRRSALQDADIVFNDRRLSASGLSHVRNRD